jgi:nucleoside-diphosphate-sugar epimerase
MDGGVAHLGSVIAAHLREWDTSPAFVELAIFERDDARVIAAAIDVFYACHLGARVAAKTSAARPARLRISCGPSGKICC